MQSLIRSLICCAILSTGIPQCLMDGANRAEAKEPLFPAAELVGAALRAELNLDSTMRATMLARAVAEWPNDGPAHWQSGHVRVGDKWLTVEEAEKRSAADPLLIEYRRLRQQSGDELNGQIALARWCHKQDLVPQEQLHWACVMQMSPQNKEAQRRLGLQLFRGQYLTREQIDRYKKYVESVEAAVKKWKPQAQRWKAAITGRDPVIRDTALAELGRLEDLEAIPALEEFLAPASPEAELAVVGVLSRIDEQIATDLLVRHAVLAEQVEVREAAARALKPRSIFAYVPALIGIIKAPIEYSYLADSLRTEGPDAIFEILSPIELITTVVWQRSRLVSATVEQPVTSAIARMQKAEAVDRINRQSQIRNKRVYEALQIATGQKQPDDPHDWWRWWNQFNELQQAEDSSQKTTIRTQQTIRTVRSLNFVGSPISSSAGAAPAFGFSGQAIPVGGGGLSNGGGGDNSEPPLRRRRYNIFGFRAQSCFLRGTKVWLDSGPTAIENVRVGDRVLSQHPETGELDYRFVVETTVRPPSKSLKIGLPTEEIATTLGHPIWVVGKGWRMAKEVVVGDHLHGIHGGVPVESIETGPEVDAFNLVVADFNTYFVGSDRILVHDNSPRAPTKAILPGFVPNELEVAASP